MKSEVYDIITHRIVSMLEAGTCPWRRPWNHMAGYPQNFASGREYQGINLFLLCTIGYEVPQFLTFNQVTERKGTIKKGSKGMPIVYWKLLNSEELDSKGEPKKIPLLRYYTVFNAAQIEGVEFPTVPSRTGSTFEPLTEAEEIVRTWKDGPKITHGFAQASYYPETDTIEMPSPGSFDSPHAYYATLFHEMGHATGSKRRLSRKQTGRFGSDAYSREELVAEMTSAFLCVRCGIDNSTMQQQTAYLAGWIHALKDDPTLVVTAASQAKKAAAFILGATGENNDQEAV